MAVANTNLEHQYTFSNSDGADTAAYINPLTDPAVNNSFPTGLVNQGFSTTDKTGALKTLSADATYVPQGASPWTIECWLYYPTGAPDTNCQIASAFNGANRIFGLRFQASFSGSPFFQIQSATDPTMTLTVNTGTPLALDTWHHGAIVWSGSTIQFYINGVAFGSPSGALGGYTSVPDLYYVGAYVFGHAASVPTSGNSMNGNYMDGYRIWSRALSQPELADIYSNSTESIFVAPPAAPTARLNWVDTPQSQGYIDLLQAIELSFVAPAGGEEYIPDATVPVSWTRDNPDVQYIDPNLVRIDIERGDSPGTWTPVVASVDADDLSTSFVAVPTPGFFIDNQVRLRFVDLQTSNVIATSSLFTFIGPIVRINFKGTYTVAA